MSHTSTTWSDWIRLSDGACEVFVRKDRISAVWEGHDGMTRAFLEGEAFIDERNLKDFLQDLWGSSVKKAENADWEVEE